MRRAAVLAAALLLVLASIAAALWAGRSVLVRWSLEWAQTASDGRLRLEDVGDSGWDGLQIGVLRWRDPAPAAGEGDAVAGAVTEVELRDVRLRWSLLALLERKLRIDSASVGSASVRLPASDEPARPPASLSIPLRLDLRELAVERLVVQAAADAQPLTLSAIRLALRYEPGGFELGRLALATDWGGLRLEGRIGDAAPFALGLKGRFDSEWRGLPVEFSADGTLQALSVRARASASGAVEASAQVRPFEAQPLGPVAVAFEGFEPAGWGLGERWRARLDGSGTVRWRAASGEAPWAVEGEAQLANAAPGRPAAGALPLAALRTRFAWQAGVLRLDGIEVSTSGGARLEGEVRVDTGRTSRLAGTDWPQVRADLALRGIDPAEWLDAAPAAKLDGRARVDGARFDLDLADRSRGATAVRARGGVDATRLIVDEARVAGLPGLAAGSAQVRGTVALAPPHDAALEGDFARVDPAALPSVAAAFGAATAAPAWLGRLPGSVDGRWSLRGPLVPARPAAGAAAPGPAPLRAALQLTSGTLAGLPARADLQASIGAARFTDARAEIALGQSRVQARGALGAPGDRLEFSLALDSLAQVATLAGLPRLAGSASASGSLQGRFEAPEVRARGRVAAFAFGDSVRARAATWSIDLPSFAGAPEAARLALRADAEGLDVGGLRWSRAGVSASGSLRAHELAATVQAPAYALSLRADGGVAADGRWAGTVRALDATGSLDVQLRDPVRVEWGGGAASLGPAELRSRFGSLRLARAGWRDGRFDVAAEATLQRLAELAQALGVTLPPEAWPARLDELQLAARADLAGASAEDLSGTLAVRLRGTNGDTAQGDADLAVQSGALSGSVDLRVPTLAFANRLVGPEWVLDGRLRVSARVGGRVTEPRLEGAVTGEALRMEQRAMGWRLGDGALAGRFDGDRFRVDSLRLAGLGPRGGSVELAGEIALADRSGAFRLRADKLLVPIGPGQKVVLSGSAEATSRAGRFELRGSLRADEGLIELRGGEAPSLPDDVVVVRRDAAGTGKGGQGARGSGESANGEAANGEARAFAIASDVTLDLGENLRVRGNGLDARLTGSLNLRGTLPDAPRAFGTVRVRDGRFTAYGQELQIVRGRVVFNGALDNPVLDIVAMRRNQPVEAGVALTGTALSPRLRLVSQPDVPDSEKLSWLVLGAPLESASTQAQAAALSAAAATLFGGNDGSLAAGVSSALGLDVSVRGASQGGLRTSGLGESFGTTMPPVPGQASGARTSSASAGASVVAIGKRLGTNLTVTYEQGLRGAWNLLMIQYDISRRVSLRAQTGSESAVDVLLRHSFD